MYLLLHAGSLPIPIYCRLRLYLFLFSPRGVSTCSYFHREGSLPVPLFLIDLMRMNEAVERRARASERACVGGRV